jgi:hypothetical protein
MMIWCTDGLCRFDNATIDAVKAANTAITTALVTAQQALAVPCNL